MVSVINKKKTANIISTVTSADLSGLYEGEDYVGRYHTQAGPRITRIVQLVKFKKDDRVLDIGCGNGLLLPEIAGKIKHYDGVDFSKTFINQASKRAQGFNIPKNKYAFHCGDIVKFCSTHKTFDKIFALDFTEHINDEEFINIFSAIKKCLKRGGLLIIHTPNKDYFIERLKSEQQRVAVQGHIGLRSAREYEKLLTKAGYKKIKIFPINHYVKILRPLHLLSKLPIHSIARLFEARLVILCEVH